MFLFININNITLYKFSPNVSAIGRIGLRTSEPSEATTPELNIGWQEAVDKKSIFSLLSWHTRVSKFEGRDEEMQELKDWAEADTPIWAKFVVAEGGTGKSRLGAEFAEQMQAEGWAAGFLDLREPQDFQMNEKGTLLVIDYPEDQIKNVTELLTDLTKIQPSSKIRVLLLTRQSLASWDSVIGASKSRNLVDIQNPIYLKPLDSESATAIFNSTADRALKLLESELTGEAGETGIDETAMATWLDQSAENNRALFIMAAAVHSADKPAEEIVKYSGRDVIEALVTRELDRWESTALAKGFESRYALARLWAMASIANRISLEQIKKMIDSGLPIGITNSKVLAEQLETTGVLLNGKVHAPKPDIVAAAFLVKVFGQDVGTAPELLWAALETDIEGGLDRIGRLSYDAEVQLGIHDDRISDWLAKAAEGNLNRCKALSNPLIYRKALGLRYAHVIVLKMLAENATDESDRAVCLTNLALTLSELGDNSGALKFSERSIVILRRLYEDNRSMHSMGLAMGLNNLSQYLWAANENQLSLNAITEAVDIMSCYHEGDTTEFRFSKVTFLTSLSISLSRVMKTQPALEAIKEAVDIMRQVYESDQSAFGPHLAMTLNSLSNRLIDAGEIESGLKFIKEAVNIYRDFYDKNPASYGDEFTILLNNLSIYLSYAGESQMALEAINEVVDIRQLLYESDQAAYALKLGNSLYVRGNALIRRFEAVAGALNYKECIKVLRPHVKEGSFSREAQLLKVVESLLSKISIIEVD